MYVCLCATYGYICIYIVTVILFSVALFIINKCAIQAIIFSDGICNIWPGWPAGLRAGNTCAGWPAGQLVLYKLK